MKQKTALLAILALVTASAVAAEEGGVNKPPTSPIEKKTDAPSGGSTVDFKELFGCEPMGEGGHMPAPKPAAGAEQQGAVQSSQEQDRMQGKRF